MNSTQRRSRPIEKEHSYHGLEFVTGIVGPWSLAEKTQNAVHDLIGGKELEGQDENSKFGSLTVSYFF